MSPGQKLGKYEVLDLLGQGGNGVVYLVRDTVLHKRWAMKQLFKDKQVLEEALIMRELDHVGIPRITEKIEDDTYYYLVMDYCKGESLAKYCRSHKVTTERVVDWGIQLCDILEYLHTRDIPVIFRDMKPENVICDENGRLKLIDFGIAKLEEGGYDAKGTKGFAAPEQYRGIYSIRSDIYNLGATLLWCMRGKKHLILERLLRKAVSERVEKRYACAAVLKKKLIRLQKRMKKRNMYFLRAVIVVLVGSSLNTMWIHWETTKIREEISLINHLLLEHYEKDTRSYMQELQYRKKVLSKFANQYFEDGI